MTTSVRLQRISWAADDVRLYDLRSFDGSPLPAWTAGAHVDLHLPNALVRQYSLLPSARSDTYRIGVKRAADSTGGTRWLFSRGQVGAELQVSEPRNHFPLRAGPAVLIGGGIGVTPLVAMAHELACRPAGGGEWTLHYAVARRSQAAFLDDLAHLTDGHPERVRLHVDAEAGGVLDLERIVAESTAATDGVHLYCCGPLAMLEAFQRATAAAGVGEDRAHVEYFEPPAGSAGGAATVGFTVVLARSGRRLDIAAGATILGTLREAGLSVMASCERGICGTCETDVLGGIPDHQDSLLTAEEKAEGTSMMICCSGSLTPELILDL
jgi:vanillate O-demethylase ferredoxin subunit